MYQIFFSCYAFFCYEIYICVWFFAYDTLQDPNYNKSVDQVHVPTFLLWLCFFLVMKSIFVCAFLLMILCKIQTDKKNGRSHSCSKFSFLVMFFFRYEIYICVVFFLWFYARSKLITRVVDQVHIPSLLFWLCFFFFVIWWAIIIGEKDLWFNFIFDDFFFFLLCLCLLYPIANINIFLGNKKTKTWLIHRCWVDIIIWIIISYFVYVYLFFFLS